MVLNDVFQRPCIFVEAPPVSNPYLFCHCDLNVVDKIPVPDRLKHRVGESECQEVLNRLFAQVVVNSVNLLFGK